MKLFGALILILVSLFGRIVMKSHLKWVEVENPMAKDQNLTPLSLITKYLHLALLAYCQRGTPILEHLYGKKIIDQNSENALTHTGEQPHPLL